MMEGRLLHRTFTWASKVHCIHGLHKLLTFFFFFPCILLIGFTTLRFNITESVSVRQRVPSMINLAEHPTAGPVWEELTATSFTRYIKAIERLRGKIILFKTINCRRNLRCFCGRSLLSYSGRSMIEISFIHTHQIWNRTTRTGISTRAERYVSN